MSLLQIRTELFAPVSDTEQQVCVPVMHSTIMLLCHEMCLLSLFATTQATEKRQNIAAKLKTWKNRKVIGEKRN
jgi:hypothetical protein